MNTAPEVPPVRHVTVLALETPSRRRALLPLFVGVLEGRAVQGEPIAPELMAARAEISAKEGRGPCDAAMRELRAGTAVSRGAIAARRTEVFVAAHVTARANDPARLESGVEVWIGDKSPRLVERGPLLGDGGVAPEARARGCRLPSRHFHELARDAGAHALRMERGLPVPELHGMAGAAGFRLQRALDR